MREIRDTVLIFSFFLMFGLISGCATPLADPMGPNSSLVVGRVVINNQFQGSLGQLPIGTVQYGIEVEIVSEEESQFIKATTGRGGYFVVPNIPPNTYYLSKVTFKGSSTNETDTAHITLRKGHFFIPVPGKILDIGTYSIDASESFRITAKPPIPFPEAAKAHLAERYAGTPWLARQFSNPQSQSRNKRRYAPRCLDDPQYRREFPLLCGQ